MYMIDTFLSYLKNVRFCSEATIEAYGSDMAIFESWLEKLGTNICDVSISDVRVFVSEMADCGLAPSSINRMLSSIRGFYKYAIREKLLSSNPTVGVRNLKTRQYIKSFLFPDVMRSFCELPENVNVLWAVRDMALFMSLYSTGCRVSELTSLSMEDFSSDLKSAIVRGKGRKDREVFFTSFAIDALRKYFVERDIFLKKKNKLECRDNPVFLNLRGTRLSIWGVNYIIKRYSVLLPDVKNISPHSFRHSFATALIKNGADIRVVQELLGHECISTTQQYTHVTSKTLYELYRKAHPHS